MDNKNQKHSSVSTLEQINNQSRQDLEAFLKQSRQNFEEFSNQSRQNFEDFFNQSRQDTDEPIRNGTYGNIPGILNSSPAEGINSSAESGTNNLSPLNNGNVRLSTRNRMDEISWSYSKSIPQIATGSIKLKNGREVTCSCLAENVKNGPYSVSVMEFSNGKIEDVTNLVVENYNKDKKYSRQQIEMIIENADKKPSLTYTLDPSMQRLSESLRREGMDIR